MKNIFILLGILIFTAGCTQNSSTNIPVENDALPVINGSAEITNKPLNDSFTHGLSTMSDTLILRLKMDSTMDHLSIPLKITSGKQLLASLSAVDKNANIRFSQVGLPDSTFDGPFGKDLNYKMIVPGKYRLIIGENMMAGDRWEGDFILRVWVK
ncbi:MAG: hypothetical protein ABI297_01665 [Ginsengibacter sp.]